MEMELLNSTKTHSTLFLVEQINVFRNAEGNSRVLLHKSFIAKVEKEFAEEIAGQNILPSSYLAGNGKQEKCYHLNFEQSLQILMSESVTVRKRVVAKLKELSQVVEQLKETPKEEVKQIAKLEDSVFFVNAFADAFSISESSKLRMFDELKGNYHIPTSLPAYAVDKPLGSVVDSAEVAVSLTELLKKHQVGISANKAYPILQSYGIVERRARKSTSGEDKKFWSITEKGLEFGKNVVSMHSPNETQALFFENRFKQVLEKLTMNNE